MSLVDSLERLVDIFENRGVAMRQYLRPSLTRAEVQTALGRLGLNPPEELYQLYEWHDGIDTLNAPKKLFMEHQFLPLNKAVQEHAELLRYNSEVLTSLDLLQCFPFAFYEGDYCAIYCDTTLIEGLQHPIINIYGGIGVIYENIDLMAQTVTEWLVSGVYDSSPVDDDLHLAIRERLNPRIPERNTSL